jgi:hypothetical protein
VTARYDEASDRRHCAWVRGKGPVVVLLDDGEKLVESGAILDEIDHMSLAAARHSLRRMEAGI